MYRLTITAAAIFFVVACSDNDNNRGGAQQDTLAPVIEKLMDISLNADTDSDAIAIQVQDETTNTQNLSVSTSSTDENIVSSEGLSLSLSGNNRTLIITPQPDTIGQTTITISTSDLAGNTASESFLVTITPREILSEDLIQEIVLLDADADPLFINQVLIVGEVDPDLGFDALVE